ncbi:hypothetical protein M409DRAFT_21821 [Zasmidium cellare ATCC 36951]|uniref:BTB domain-containing protein n=1 Tax=Zasmidium cellare ATCC 36951 TaxID=1080233 RepID=A0A6A6CKJ1_ZASCE|nr:uncharacterized protein M409DRAFT_21821 [Zasmidium cellare ATCC 36951]KAF2167665.1 hypothetical protein M409DRAFT_21821 [Zasmidium cellare ATCC 36951]
MSDFDFDFRFPSTPRTFDRMPRPYGYGLRAPPGSFARDEWHNLNEELTQNVEREFPPYAEDEGSVFEEDVFQSTTSLLPKQEPSDRKVKTEDEKMDFPSEIATPVPPKNDYMGRESPFALDFPPHSEMSFIEYYPQGDATITFPNEAGEMDSISGLHPWIMEERCPLLAQSFEDTRSGPRLHLEVLSPRTARPFLRYLYTGSYALPGRSGDVYEDVPTSVLLHCELYRLGDIYDLVDLRQQANVNVTRQCEFGCSSPDKPIDLCAAIEYVYQHLRDHTALLETIICYCVTCFLRHNLDDDVVFQALAYRLREFNQDLCRESMKRDFEDEAAAAIIRMPFEPYIPETYASREDVGTNRLSDVVYHFHSNDDNDEPPKKRKKPEMSQGPGISGISLALRFHQEKKRREAKEGENASLSEEPDPKRRASVVSESSNTVGETGSESEYEVVAGPAPVEELSSDSESDADTLVIVEHLEAIPSSTNRTLPIRNRSAASSMTLGERETTQEADSGSESDWTVV